MYVPSIYYSYYRKLAGECFTIHILYHYHIGAKTTLALTVSEVYYYAGIVATSLVVYRDYQVATRVVVYVLGTSAFVFFETSVLFTVRHELSLETRVDEIL